MPDNYGRSTESEVSKELHDLLYPKKVARCWKCGHAMKADGSTLCAQCWFGGAPRVAALTEAKESK